MKKTFTRCCICMMLSFIYFTCPAQTFIFPGVSTDAGCYDGSAYTLHSSIKITGVKVVQVYYDDQTTGTGNSFSYEIVFTYDNVFVGQVNSTGNFYTYTVTMHTNNPLAGGTITNNGSNIPLMTDSMANMNLHNNPTYHYSASQMGLQAGVTYTDASTIALFGYDSASLTAAAPCLNVTEGAHVTSTIPLFTSLNDFNARMNEGRVMLSWNTETETNNAGFMLQKSNNSKDWRDLQWIASKAENGNSIHTFSYNALDDKPEAGSNFYRLIQTDIDKHISISKTVLVVNNVMQNEMLIYPNPASNTIHIHSKTTLLNEAFSLKTITGVIVKSGKVHGKDIEVNISDIAAGIYILQAGNVKQKIIIEH